MTRICRTGRLIAVAVVCVTVCRAVYGWPSEVSRSVGRQILATTPAKETVRLKRYEGAFVDGAGVDDATLLEHLLVFKSEVEVDTVEREIQLMREVTRESITPYCAFRLGALSAFVADMSYPLPRVPASDYQKVLKERFDKEILELYPSQIYSFKPRRVIISAQEYFSDTTVFPGVGEALLISRYENPAMEDMTAGTLVVYFSNAVNSGADVLHTILLEGPSLGPDYPPGNDAMAQYYLSELKYYLALYDKATDKSEYATGEENVKQMKYMKEIRRVVNLLGRDEYYTVEIGEKIGDALFEVGKFSDGLEQYKTVLSMNSTLKRVRDKISAYYMAVGLKLKSENKWEEARETFWNVLRNDLDHKEARKQMNEVKTLIQKRGERRAGDQALIAQGNRATADGSSAVSEKKLLAGMKKYRQAEKFFQQVTAEFPELQAQAAEGIQDARQRAVAAENMVVTDIRNLRDIADTYTSKDEFRNALGEGIDETVLRMVEQDLEKQVDELIQKKIIPN
ncbi:hypothetical protein ACFL1X_13575 [Candidatus Hydrogenedentota bacterium]